MREQEIQRLVFQHLAVRRMPGTIGFHPANGGFRRPAEAAILQGLGVLAGIPDVVLCRGGRMYCLELKVAGGRLSPVQRQVHDRLREAGAEVATAHGLDEALVQLERWGLLRGCVQASKSTRLITLR
jgi:hypothetical protein